MYWDDFTAVPKVDNGNAGARTVDVNNPSAVAPHLASL